MVENDGFRNDRKAVYDYFMNGSPLVRLTTGAIIGGIVNRDYVTVHSAPPKALREILTNFVMVDLKDGEVRIPLIPENES